MRMLEWGMYHTKFLIKCETKQFKVQKPIKKIRDIEWYRQHMSFMLVYVLDIRRQIPLVILYVIDY